MAKRKPKSKGQATAHHPTGHHELPHAFVERVHTQLAHEAPAFLAALETQAPTSLRLNPAKALSLQANLPRQGILPPLSPVPWCPWGHYVEVGEGPAPVFTLDPLHHAGAYYVQEASSMLLHQMLPQLPPQAIVVDVAAAPGGKSTHLLSMLPPGGLLIAAEPVPNRATALAENITRWGSHNTVVLNAGIDALLNAQTKADLVLLDAPCSGEGLFRKQPEARLEWSQAAVKRCSTLQGHLLRDATKLLKLGGHLIYSTCTLAEEENELQVAALLKAIPQLALALPVANTGWGVKESTSGWHALPHRLRGEGFFVTRFSLQEPLPDNPITYEQALKLASRKPLPRQRKPTPTTPWVPSKQLQSDLETLIPSASELGLLAHRRANQVAALPSAHLQTLAALYANAKVLHAGLPLWTEKPDRNSSDSPGHIRAYDHALALQAPKVLSIDSFHSIELTHHQALRFLKKAPLLLTELPTLPATTSLAPYILVTHMGLGLGWAQPVGGEMLSQLPNALAIRMALPTQL